MERVGVMAVVEGIESFKGDMGKIDSAINSIIPTSKLLGGAFDWLGDTVSNFVSGAARVLEYALGGLIKDAIEAVIGAIQDLIGEVISAGNEFQTLTIRLNGMNLTQQSIDVNGYAKAMSEAKDQTKEQLGWIQALSTATPFNATDIAETYSLARSYGFADVEAQKLTEDITNYTAAMGLGSDAIVRTMQNFGQMEARGKVNMQVIRNLTRSAYLPLEAVLGRVGKKMGMTVAEVTSLISKPGEGVSSEIFLAAFQEMVNEEPRFIGAAGRLGRAFDPAVNNVKDLARNIGGLNIVTPVLDVMGERVASLIDELVYFNEAGDMIKTEKWTMLENAAKRVGTALSGLINDIIGVFMPSSSTMVDGMIGGLNSVADWFTEHRGMIIEWAQNAKSYIDTTLVPALKGIRDWLFGTTGEDMTKGKKGQERPGAPTRPTEKVETQGNLAVIFDKIATAAEKASKWVGEVLMPFIRDNLIPVLIVLQPLAEAIGEVLITAFGGEPNEDLSTWINETLIPGIQGLTTWITENKDTIALWLDRLLIGALAIMLFSAAIILIVGVISEVVSAFIGWLIASGNITTILLVLVTIAAIVGAVIAGVPIAIFAVIAVIIALGVVIAKNWDAIKKWATDTYNKIADWNSKTSTVINDWVKNTWASLSNWTGDALASLTEWGTSGAGIFTLFTSDTLASIAKWAVDTLAKIATWATDVVNKIKSGLLSATWSSVGTSIFNAIYNSLMNFNWFSIGVSIIQQIISGFTSIKLPAVTPPTTSPPSADGGNMHRAAGTHGMMTVPPGFNSDNFSLGLTSGEKFMVIPRGGQISSAMMGESVNASQQIINNLQLTINSSAQTENLVADYEMMKSLLGA